MKRLHEIALGVSRGGAIVGGALLLLAAVTICIDIFLRYAFSLTVGGADDLSGYALAIASAWGFSAALLSRSHIRIDTLYVRLPRARARHARPRRASRASPCSSRSSRGMPGACSAVLRLRLALDVGARDAARPAAVVWLAGLAFFLAVALLLLARALPAYATRRPRPGCSQAIGSKSAVAEAKEEIIAVGRAIDIRKE